MKMNRWNWKPRRDRAGEAGQAIVYALLLLGTFLLGALCFAFDLSNIWYHRQSAQSAADAACAAGAMDILVKASGGSTSYGSQIGTAYSCTTSSTDSVCSYAKKNGYDAGTTNAVSVSFPTTAANGAPPGVPIPSGTSNPFIRVDIVDHVQTFFIGLLSGSSTKDVRTFSTCGVAYEAAPIPLLVLNPTNPKALTVQGANNPAPGCDNTAGVKSKVCIWGGPQQSVQVDSNASNAAYLGGGANIDLAKGGPSNTGSNLGTWGGPITAPGGFLGGSTGTWLAPSAPISDPFASLAVPSTAGLTTYTGPYRTATPADLPGIVCPDTACDEYAPGIYSSGICVTSGGKSPCSCQPGGGRCTAIFDPGVYIIQGTFNVQSNSCLRPSGALGDGTGGVMFYFTNGGSVTVGADSGNKCQADFVTAGYVGSSSLANGIKCKSTSNVPSNLTSVTSLSGNVLLAPCSGTYGDPYEAKGLTDPDGEQHGFLMFQDRSTASANQSWGGGGAMLLAGTMYFHNSTDFSDTFTLTGNSGSSTYVLGDIVADDVSLSGDSQVTMDLNTSVVFSVFKASIFQ
jgi:Flp pilus assembly protein TadG